MSATERADTPRLVETALGGFFQDIGKLVQRAYGAARTVDTLLSSAGAREVRARESVVLPTYKGRYSHRHVFWSDAFFQWCEEQGLSLPPEGNGARVNLAQVRRMAVHHHRPDEAGSLGWLAAEADRLSSGMDRDARQDTGREADAEVRGWDAFIRTPLVSPFSQVDLGLGAPPRRELLLAELAPGDDLLPRERVDTTDYPARYRRLWEGFREDFRALLTTARDADAMCAGLLAISERYTCAVPSSTVDVPDISLHDHNRTVAAIAACMHAWHDREGTLGDAAAVRDRGARKFRLLAGDLSGIQSTLLLLASEQVKGVNRILRARSFLMGALLETAALLARRRLGLSAFNVLQNAGGRFVLLVPHLASVEETVAGLGAEIDAWMRARYFGSLSLNLALSPPFAGEDFMRGRFGVVQAALGVALEEAKQRPLARSTLR